VKARDVLASNWWLVAAYLTMVLWLVVINHRNIGLDFGFGPTDFAALSQLDSVAHFTVALSLAAAFTQVRGRWWTLPKLLAVIVLWEAFEVYALLAFGKPDLFAMPDRRGLVDLVYLFDTLDDIALGTAGALVGCFLGAEGSNTPEGIKEASR